MGAFSNFIKGVTTVLPEIKKPIRSPTLTEKLLWTAIALALYLTMAQIPLYGIQQGGSDPNAYARIIFASSRGTLMELGIGPIVTAGLILQLLKGSEIIRLDFKKPEERALFTSATKFLTLIVILMEALAYLLGGAFGRNLASTTIVIILMQLFAAGIVVMLLDELVQKGWGLGSGISLFILAGVAQQVMWSLFSTLPTNQGALGVIPFTIQMSFVGKVSDALFRSGGFPSLFTLALTILVILVIVYVEGVRIEVPITSTQYRGFAGVYPIKLLYVSNIPVILTSALIANLTFLTQFLSVNYSASPFLTWFAAYNSTNPGQLTGGLLYYMTSPRLPENVVQEPLRAVTYVLFLVVFAIMFAKIWVEIGGLSPKAVAKSLLDAKVQVPGFRRAEDSVEGILSRYIPAVTIIGAIFIGLLASTSDLLGVFGSGIGILLMIDILLQYYQLLVREHVETIMPRLGAVLGR